MSLLSQSDDQADESELDAHSLSWYVTSNERRDVAIWDLSRLKNRLQKKSSSHEECILIQIYNSLDGYQPLWNRRNCWGKPVLSYAAFIMLGIAPQLLQNMIYAEAPLFALYAPEKKAIQAHIIASFMVANLVTLCYLVLQFFKHISYDRP